MTLPRIRRRFRFFPQVEDSDCGPACLKMIAHHYGKQVPLAEIRDSCGIQKQGASLRDLTIGGQRLGLECVAVRADLATLIEHAQLPAVLFWRGNHFVVLYRIEVRKEQYFFHIADPGYGRMRLSQAEFTRSWLTHDGQGTAVLVQPNERWEQFAPAVDREYFGVREALAFVGQHAVRYRGGLGVVALTLLVTAAVSWVLPLLVKYLIDDGVMAGQYRIVYLVIIAQAGIVLGRAIVQYIEGRVLAKLSMNISVDIIVGFLQKLIRLPLNYFDSRMHTDLLQRIQDQGKIETFISYQFIQVVFDSLTLLVMSALLFYYSPMIFLIFWGLTLIAMGWITVFLRKRRQLDYARFSIQTVNSNSLLELITGMPEIKINSAQNGKLTAWKGIQEKLYRLKVRALHLNHFQLVGSETITQFKNIGISLLSAVWVISGDMTLGTMVSITYITGVLTAPLVGLINFSRTAQDAKLSFERLQKIQRRPDENVGSLTPLPLRPAALSCRALTFRYRRNDSTPVLTDLCAEFPVGKVTAIVGDSGSGKTTLMKLLLRFYQPERGQILLDEVDLASTSSDDWRARCGVVMQDGFVYSDTIAGNVSMQTAEDTDHERVAFALRMACLTDYIEQLPQGVSTVIGNAGVALSGGQQQRLLIARAIYRDPEFLFFDEATSMLDTITERRIMDNLATFFRGRTVIVIAHRLSTVQNADQLIVMQSGRVVERGNHQQLVARQGQYFELVRNQLELAT